MKRDVNNIIKIKNNGDYRHRGEMLAANYLIECGHLILCHNFHAKFSEIDIISIRNDELHFIEVKNYSGDACIHPLESLTRHKINKMRQAARVFYREYLNLSEASGRNDKATGEIIIDIVSLQPSFDLLWVKDDNNFEFFCGLF